MPLSGKLPNINQYAGPYPRPKDSVWFLLRSALLLCWIVIGYYAGNAIWNFYYTDYSKPKTLATAQDVLNALVVPAFMRDPNNPFGVSITFALLFVLILLGCLWATRDWRRERKVVQERELDEGINKGFRVRGLDKKFTKPQEPPFDTDNPSHPGKFIGRAEEVKWLLERLRTDKHRITALWGPGNVGKTVLAVEVARRLQGEKRFKHGIVVIPCKGQTIPEDIIQQIIIRFDAYSRPPKSNDPLELKKDIIRLLHGKSTLIMLDSIEYSLNIKEVINYLFPAKGVTLLLITQFSLSIQVVPADGNHRLEPLSPAEALELFASSFGQPVNDPQNTGYHQAEGIVRNLGYRPYAISLIGSHAKSYGYDLATIEEELNKNEEFLKLIERADHDKAEGRAFEISTNALPPEAQNLLTALTAFPDVEFSRAAVVAVARHLDAENAVDLLVQRGLMDAYVNESMPEQSHRTRRQIQPLTRAFASANFQKLSPAEKDAIHHVIASFYADYCLKVDSMEVSEEALSYDEANILGALEWANTQHDDALITKLCSGMQYFWVSSSRVADGQKYLPEGIKAAQTIADQTQRERDRSRLATLQQTYAQLLQKVGQTDIAQTHFEQAHTVFKDMKDQEGQYGILASLGELAQQRGDLGKAQSYYGQSLAILRILQDEQHNEPDQQEENEVLQHYRQNEAEILISLGELAQQRGRLAAAITYYEQSLTMLQEIDSHESQILTLIHLGEIAQYRRQNEEATQRFKEALAIAEQVKDSQKKGIVLARMAELALALKQTRAAQNYCKKAQVIAHDEQDHNCQCRVLYCMGKLEKNAVFAEQRYKNALKLARTTNDKQAESKVNLYLAELARLGDHIGEAETYYRAALAILATFYEAILYAEIVLKLGTLLLEHHLQSEEQPNEGCEKIQEAVDLYASMKLPNEREAREISKRLGCRI